MDKEHRHELQQSDLEEAIKNWKQLWAKYGTHVLMAILIVLAFFVFTRWYSGRETRIMEEAYGALADNATARGKRQVAADYAHVPGLAGLATLQAADLTLRQALNLTAQPGDLPAPAPTPEELKSKLNDAAAMYQEVIDLKGPTLHTINAHFGLAAVHESLGNFDKAAEHYDAVVAAAGEDWAHLGEMAERHKSELKRISVPVTFAKPKPIAPETGAGSPDAPAPSIFRPTEPDATDPAPGTTDPAPAPAPGTDTPDLIDPAPDAPSE